MIRKIRLAVKFLTSEPGYETVTIYILPNISRNKGNQTMKLGQLIEYNKKNILFKNDTETEAGILVPDLFLLFRKA